MVHVEMDRGGFPSADLPPSTRPTRGRRDELGIRLPLGRVEKFGADEIRAHHGYFLGAVLPVAEEVGVWLAVAPMTGRPAGRSAGRRGRALAIGYLQRLLKAPGTGDAS
jgi:hypothetical protein